MCEYNSETQYKNCALFAICISIFTLLGVFFMETKICSFSNQHCFIIKENCITTDESVLIVKNSNLEKINKEKVKIACFSPEIKKISHHQFLGFRNLKHVLLPNELEIIPEYAFACCENLSDIIIPESVDKIQSYAFLGCRSLEQIEINKCKIEKYAFAECVELKNLIINNTDQKIDKSSFIDCKKLEKLCVPLHIFNEKELPKEFYLVKEITLTDIQNDSTITSENLENYTKLKLLILDKTKDEAKILFKGYGNTKLKECELQLKNGEKNNLSQLLEEIKSDT